MLYVRYDVDVASVDSADFVEETAAEPMDCCFHFLSRTVSLSRVCLLRSRLFRWLSPLAL